MSSANFRRFDIDAMAQRALWFDRSQLDAMFRVEITPSRGVNKDERADIRDRVRKRIAELRKSARRPAAKPRQPVERHYPDIPLVPPYSDIELLRAVREIGGAIRRYKADDSTAAWNFEPSEAAAWMIKQLRVPSCLESLTCAPGGEVCGICRWIFALHSTTGREGMKGTMFELETKLGLLQV